MLRTWQISNFKSIRKMDKPLEFAPLTVFCGANSSGKSSLLQSILLFKQTLQKKHSSPRMALNGRLVQLGRLDDILSNGADGEVSCVFQISSYRYRKPEGETGRYKPNIWCDKELYLLTECRVCIDDPENSRKFFNRRPLATAIRITDMLAGEPVLDCSYIHEGDPEFPVSDVYLLKGEGVFDKHLSPESWTLSPRSNTPADSEKELYAKLQGKTASPIISRAFPDFFPYVTFDNSELAKQYRVAKMSIRRFFCNKLYYVGPLRADPKEHNDPTSQDTNVGYRGEYSAECYEIRAHRWELYPCFFSPEFYDTENGPEYSEKIRTGEIKTVLQNLAQGNFSSYLDKDILKSSLVEWLIYLEIADDVDIDRNGELVVKQGKRNWKRLNNVGVGVSQALPIVLQCILAGPGSTIIIEQPELHLHPRTQSRLADFFLVMSLLGKQIIIETHSEYIIDKLRLRIVQAPGDSLVDKVAVYFAEKKNGNSEFRRIRINEYSVMSEWPKGFFEDSVQIARDIMSAIHQKREESGRDGDDND